MKKYFIVLLLIIAQLGAFYLKSHSQIAHKNLYEKDFCIEPTKKIKWSSENTNVKNKEVEILADETTLSYTDKYAKIECDNDSIFYKIFTTHYQIITRFTASWKYDRHGRYKHYVIYLSREDAELVKSWATKNL